MELKNFISQTLVNIVEGVNEANKGANRFSLASSVHLQRGTGQDVEFDISLTASRDSQGNVGGKIGVALAHIGSDINQSEKNENIHRIKFKVFISEPREHS